MPDEADRTKKKGRLKRNHWVFPEGNLPDHKENSLTRAKKTEGKVKWINQGVCKCQRSNKIPNGKTAHFRMWKIKNGRGVIIFQKQQFQNET